MPNPHVAVLNRAGEYVRRQAHFNVIESGWAMLKRGYVGFNHWFSTKHLDRYEQKYAGWRNLLQLESVLDRFPTARLTWPNS